MSYEGRKKTVSEVFPYIIHLKLKGGFNPAAFDSIQRQKSDYNTFTTYRKDEGAESSSAHEDDVTEELFLDEQVHALQTPVHEGSFASQNVLSELSTLPRLSQSELSTAQQCTVPSRSLAPPQPDKYFSESFSKAPNKAAATSACLPSENDRNLKIWEKVNGAVLTLNDHCGE